MKTQYLACTSTNCRKTFRNESSLLKHLNHSHSESENNSENGYKCRKCNKILSSKQSLKEHYHTHTGRKPYKCSEPGCGLFFRQSSQFSYHKKIHFEAKKYFNEFAKADPGCFNGFSKNLPEIMTGSHEEGITPTVLPKITGPQANVKLPNIFS